MTAVEGGSAERRTSLGAQPLLAVQSEVQRAVQKHGDEAMLSPDLDDGKRLAILGEEYGEVCRALTYDNNQGLEHLASELIQTAAMALSWAQVVYDKIAAAAAADSPQTD